MRKLSRRVSIISAVLLALTVSVSFALDESRPQGLKNIKVNGQDAQLATSSSSYDESLWRKNEPSGMTSGLFSNRDFLAKAENGWWQGGERMALAATADEISTSKQAARMYYEAGFKGGYAPTSTGYDKFASKEVYICFSFMVSPNWQNHPTGTNKIMFITSSGFGGGGDPMFLAYDSRFEPPQFTINHQGPRVSILKMQPNLKAVPVKHGETALVELHLIMNSEGRSDGQAHMWVNGIKTTEIKNVQWVDSGYVWDSIRWEPTWGGGGGTVAQKMYQEIAKIYISIK